VGVTVELVVAILLVLVIDFVVDVKDLGALLVVALVLLVVLLVVETFAGVGVFVPGPCAKAQFEQWYELGE